MTTKEIAKACKKQRGERTKYQLAKAAKLSIGQIERIESGELNYTVNMLNKYLTALNVKIEIK